MSVQSLAVPGRSWPALSPLPRSPLLGFPRGLSSGAPRRGDKCGDCVWPAPTTVSAPQPPCVWAGGFSLSCRQLSPSGDDPQQGHITDAPAYRGRARVGSMPAWALLPSRRGWTTGRLRAWFQGTGLGLEGSPASSPPPLAEGRAAHGLGGRRQPGPPMCTPRWARPAVSRWLLLSSL